MNRNNLARKVNKSFALLVIYMFMTTGITLDVIAPYDYDAVKDWSTQENFEGVDMSNPKVVANFDKIKWDKVTAENMKTLNMKDAAVREKFKALTPAQIEKITDKMSADQAKEVLTKIKDVNNLQPGVLQESLGTPVKFGELKGVSVKNVGDEANPVYQLQREGMPSLPVPKAQNTNVQTIAYKETVGADGKTKGSWEVVTKSQQPAQPAAPGQTPEAPKDQFDVIKFSQDSGGNDNVVPGFDDKGQLTLSSGQPGTDVTRLKVQSGEVTVKPNGEFDLGANAQVQIFDKDGNKVGSMKTEQPTAIKFDEKGFVGEGGAKYTWDFLKAKSTVFGDGSVDFKVRDIEGKSAIVINGRKGTLEYKDTVTGKDGPIEYSGQIKAGDKGFEAVIQGDSVSQVVLKGEGDSWEARKPNGELIHRITSSNEGYKIDINGGELKGVYALMEQNGDHRNTVNTAIQGVRGITQSGKSPDQQRKELADLIDKYNAGIQSDVSKSSDAKAKEQMQKLQIDPDMAQALREGKGDISQAARSVQQVLATKYNDLDNSMANLGKGIQNTAGVSMDGRAVMNGNYRYETSDPVNKGEVRVQGRDNGLWAAITKRETAVDKDTYSPPEITWSRTDKTLTKENVGSVELSVRAKDGSLATIKQRVNANNGKLELNVGASGIGAMYENGKVKQGILDVYHLKTTITNPPVVSADGIYSGITSLQMSSDAAHATFVQATKDSGYAYGSQELQQYVSGLSPKQEVWVGGGKADEMAKAADTINKEVRFYKMERAKEEARVQYSKEVFNSLKQSEFDSYCSKNQECRTLFTNKDAEGGKAAWDQFKQRWENDFRERHKADLEGLGLEYKGDQLVGKGLEGVYSGEEELSKGGVYIDTRSQAERLVQQRAARLGQAPSFTAEQRQSIVSTEQAIGHEAEAKLAVEEAIASRTQAEYQQKAQRTQTEFGLAQQKYSEALTTTPEYMKKNLLSRKIEAYIEDTDFSRRQNNALQIMGQDGNGGLIKQIADVKASTYQNYDASKDEELMLLRGRTQLYQEDYAKARAELGKISDEYYKQKAKEMIVDSYDEQMKYAGKNEQADLALGKKQALRDSALAGSTRDANKLVQELGVGREALSSPEKFAKAIRDQADGKFYDQLSAEQKASLYYNAMKGQANDLAKEKKYQEALDMYGQAKGYAESAAKNNPALAFMANDAALYQGISQTQMGLADKETDYLKKRELFSQAEQSLNIADTLRGDKLRAYNYDAGKAGYGDVFGYLRDAESTTLQRAMIDFSQYDIGNALKSSEATIALNQFNDQANDINVKSNIINKDYEAALAGAEKYNGLRDNADSNKLYARAEIEGVKNGDPKKFSDIKAVTALDRAKDRVNSDASLSAEDKAKALKEISGMKVEAVFEGQKKLVEGKTDAEKRAVMQESAENKAKQMQQGVDRYGALLTEEEKNSAKKILAYDALKKANEATGSIPGESNYYVKVAKSMFDSTGASTKDVLSKMNPQEKETYLSVLNNLYSRELDKQQQENLKSQISEVRGNIASDYEKLASQSTDNYERNEYKLKALSQNMELARLGKLTPSQLDNLRGQMAAIATSPPIEVKDGVVQNSGITDYQKYKTNLMQADLAKIEKKPYDVVSFYEKALAANKEDKDLQKTLAGAYAAQGRDRDAGKQYKELLADPKISAAEKQEIQKLADNLQTPEAIQKRLQDVQKKTQSSNEASNIIRAKETQISSLEQKLQTLREQQADLQSQRMGQGPPQFKQGVFAADGIPIGTTEDAKVLAKMERDIGSQIRQAENELAEARSSISSTSQKQALVQEELKKEATQIYEDSLKTQDSKTIADTLAKVKSIAPLTKSENDDLSLKGLAAMAAERDRASGDKTQIQENMKKVFDGMSTENDLNKLRERTALSGSDLRTKPVETSVGYVFNDDATKFKQTASGPAKTFLDASSELEQATARRNMARELMSGGNAGDYALSKIKQMELEAKGNSQRTSDLLLSIPDPNSKSAEDHSTRAQAAYYDVLAQSKKASATEYAKYLKPADQAALYEASNQKYKEEKWGAVATATKLYNSHDTLGNFYDGLQKATVGSVGGTERLVQDRKDFLDSFNDNPAYGRALVREGKENANGVIENVRKEVIGTSQSLGKGYQEESDKARANGNLALANEYQRRALNYYGIAADQDEKKQRDYETRDSSTSWTDWSWNQKIYRDGGIIGGGGILYGGDTGVDSGAKAWEAGNHAVTRNTLDKLQRYYNGDTSVRFSPEESGKAYGLGYDVGDDNNVQRMTGVDTSQRLQNQFYSESNRWDKQLEKHPEFKSTEWITTKEAGRQAIFIATGVGVGAAANAAQKALLLSRTFAVATETGMQLTRAGKIVSTAIGVGEPFATALGVSVGNTLLVGDEFSLSETAKFGVTLGGFKLGATAMGGLTKGVIGSFAKTEGLTGTAATAAKEAFTQRVMQSGFAAGSYGKGLTTTEKLLSNAASGVQHLGSAVGMGVMQYAETGEINYGNIAAYSLAGMGQGAIMKPIGARMEKAYNPMPTAERAPELRASATQAAQQHNTNVAAAARKMFNVPSEKQVSIEQIRQVEVAAREIATGVRKPTSSELPLQSDLRNIGESGLKVKLVQTQADFAERQAEIQNLKESPLEEGETSSARQQRISDLTWGKEAVEARDGQQAQERIVGLEQAKLDIAKQTYGEDSAYAQRLEREMGVKRAESTASSARAEYESAASSGDPIVASEALTRWQNAQNRAIEEKTNFNQYLQSSGNRAAEIEGAASQVRTEAEKARTAEEFAGIKVETAKSDLAAKQKQLTDLSAEIAARESSLNSLPESSQESARQSVARELESLRQASRDLQSSVKAANDNLALAIEPELVQAKAARIMAENKEAVLSYNEQGAQSYSLDNKRKQLSGETLKSQAEDLVRNLNEEQRNIVSEAAKRISAEAEWSGKDANSREAEAARRLSADYAPNDGKTDISNLRRSMRDIESSIQKINGASNAVDSAKVKSLLDTATFKSAEELVTLSEAVKSQEALKAAIAEGSNRISSEYYKAEVARVEASAVSQYDALQTARQQPNTDAKLNERISNVEAAQDMVREARAEALTGAKKPSEVLTSSKQLRDALDVLAAEREALTNYMVSKGIVTGDQGALYRAANYELMSSQYKQASTEVRQKALEGYTGKDSAKALDMIGKSASSQFDAREQLFTAKGNAERDGFAKAKKISMNEFAIKENPQLAGERFYALDSAQRMAATETAKRLEAVRKSLQAEESNFFKSKARIENIADLKIEAASLEEARLRQEIDYIDTFESQKPGASERTADLRAQLEAKQQEIRKLKLETEARRRAANPALGEGAETVSLSSSLGNAKEAAVIDSIAQPQAKDFVRNELKSTDDALVLRKRLLDYFEANSQKATQAERMREARDIAEKIIDSVASGSGNAKETVARLQSQRAFERDLQQPLKTNLFDSGKVVELSNDVKAGTSRIVVQQGKNSIALETRTDSSGKLVRDVKVLIEGNELLSRALEQKIGDAIDKTNAALKLSRDGKFSQITAEQAYELLRMVTQPSYSYEFRTGWGKSKVALMGYKEMAKALGTDSSIVAVFGDMAKLVEARNSVVNPVNKANILEIAAGFESTAKLSYDEMLKSLSNPEIAVYATREGIADLELARKTLLRSFASGNQESLPELQKLNKVLRKIYERTNLFDEAHQLTEDFHLRTGGGDRQVPLEVIENGRKAQKVLNALLGDKEGNLADNRQNFNAEIARLEKAGLMETRKGNTLLDSPRLTQAGRDRILLDHLNSQRAQLESLGLASGERLTAKARTAEGQAQIERLLEQAGIQKSFSYLSRQDSLIMGTESLIEAKAYDVNRYGFDKGKNMVVPKSQERNNPRQQFGDPFLISSMELEHGTRLRGRPLVGNELADLKYNTKSTSVAFSEYIGKVMKNGKSVFMTGTNMDAELLSALYGVKGETTPAPYAKYFSSLMKGYGEGFDGGAYYKAAPIAESSREAFRQANDLTKNFVSTDLEGLVSKFKERKSKLKQGEIEAYVDVTGETADPVIQKSFLDGTAGKTRYIYRAASGEVVVDVYDGQGKLLRSISQLAANNELKLLTPAQKGQTALLIGKADKLGLDLAVANDIGTLDYDLISDSKTSLKGLAQGGGRDRTQVANKRLVHIGSESVEQAFEIFKANDLKTRGKGLIDSIAEMSRVQKENMLESAIEGIASGKAGIDKPLLKKIADQLGELETKPVTADRLADPQARDVQEYVQTAMRRAQAEIDALARELGIDKMAETQQFLSQTDASGKPVPIDIKFGSSQKEFVGGIKAASNLYDLAQRVNSLDVNTELMKNLPKEVIDIATPRREIVSDVVGESARQEFRRATDSYLAEASGIPADRAASVMAGIRAAPADARAKAISDAVNSLPVSAAARNALPKMLGARLLVEDMHDRSVYEGITPSQTSGVIAKLENDFALDDINTVRAVRDYVASVNLPNYKPVQSMLDNRLNGLENLQAAMQANSVLRDPNFADSSIGNYEIVAADPAVEPDANYQRALSLVDAARKSLAAGKVVEAHDNYLAATDAFEKSWADAEDSAEKARASNNPSAQLAYKARSAAALSYLSQLGRDDAAAELDTVSSQVADLQSLANSGTPSVLQSQPIDGLSLDRRGVPHIKKVAAEMAQADLVAKNRLPISNLRYQQGTKVFTYDGKEYVYDLTARTLTLEEERKTTFLAQNDPVFKAFNEHENFLKSQLGLSLDNRGVWHINKAGYDALVAKSGVTPQTPAQTAAAAEAARIKAQMDRDAAAGKIAEETAASMGVMLDNNKNPKITEAGAVQLQTDNAAALGLPVSNLRYDAEKGEKVFTLEGKEYRYNLKSGLIFYQDGTRTVFFNEKDTPSDYKPIMAELARYESDLSSKAGISLDNSGNWQISKAGYNTLISKIMPIAYSALDSGNQAAMTAERIRQQMLADEYAQKIKEQMLSDEAKAKEAERIKQQMLADENAQKIKEQMLADEAKAKAAERIRQQMLADEYAQKIREQMLADAAAQKLAEEAAQAAAQAQQSRQGIFSRALSWLGNLFFGAPVDNLNLPYVGVGADKEIADAMAAANKILADNTIPTRYDRLQQADAVLKKISPYALRFAQAATIDQLINLEANIEVEMTVGLPGAEIVEPVQAPEKTPAQIAAEAEQVRIAAEQAAKDEAARQAAAAEAEKQRLAAQAEQERIAAEQAAKDEAARQAADAEAKKQRLADEAAKAAAQPQPVAPVQTPQTPEKAPWQRAAEEEQQRQVVLMELQGLEQPAKRAVESPVLVSPAFGVNEYILAKIDAAIKAMDDTTNPSRLTDAESEINSINQDVIAVAGLEILTYLNEVKALISQKIAEEAEAKAEAAQGKPAAAEPEVLPQAVVDALLGEGLEVIPEQQAPAVQKAPIAFSAQRWNSRERPAGYESTTDVLLAAKSYGIDYRGLLGTDAEGNYEYENWKQLMYKAKTIGLTEDEANNIAILSQAMNDVLGKAVAQIEADRAEALQAEIDARQARQAQLEEQAQARIARQEPQQQPGAPRQAVALSVEDKSRTTELESAAKAAAARAFGAETVYSTGSSASYTYLPNEYGLPSDFDFLLKVNSFDRTTLNRQSMELKNSMLPTLRRIYGPNVVVVVHNYRDGTPNSQGGVDYGQMFMTFHQLKPGETARDAISRYSGLGYQKSARDSIGHMDFTFVKQYDGTEKYRSAVESQLAAITANLDANDRLVARDFILDQIRQLKFFFEIEGIYKPYEGGLRGLGTEQLVLQLANPGSVRTLGDVTRLFSADAALSKIVSQGKNLKLNHPSSNKLVKGVLGQKEAPIEIISSYAEKNKAVNFDRLVEVAKQYAGKLKPAAEATPYQRVEQKLPMKGVFSDLAYTHNAPPEALAAILGSGYIQAGEYRGANFRYGLDSDYGAVKFVMKRGFESGKTGKDKGIRTAQNLFNFFKTGRSREEIAKDTDFRSNMPSPVTPGADANQERVDLSIGRDQAVRYSYANPQLQLADNVGLGDVAAIMVPEHVWNDMVTRQALQEASKKFGFTIIPVIGTGKTASQYYAWRGSFNRETGLYENNNARDSAIRDGLARPNRLSGASPAVSSTEVTGKKAFGLEEQAYFKFLLQEGYDKPQVVVPVNQRLDGARAAGIAASMTAWGIMHGQYLRTDSGKRIHISEDNLAQLSKYLEDTYKVKFTTEESRKFLDGHESFHAFIDNLALQNGEESVAHLRAMEEKLADIFGLAWAVRLDTLSPEQRQEIEPFLRTQLAEMEAMLSDSLDVPVDLVQYLEETPGQLEDLLAKLGVADVQVSVVSEQQLAQARKAAEKESSISKSIEQDVPSEAMPAAASRTEKPIEQQPADVRETIAALGVSTDVAKTDIEKAKQNLDMLYAAYLQNPADTGLLDEISEQVFLISRIEGEYTDYGAVASLGIERLVNDIMPLAGKAEYRSSSVYVGNIDLTSANNLDKSDRLGDMLKQATLGYFRSKLAERFVDPAKTEPTDKKYNLPFTVTMIQTRLVIVGVPKEIIEEISAQYAEDIYGILESYGTYGTPEKPVNVRDLRQPEVIGGYVTINPEVTNDVKKMAGLYKTTDADTITRNLISKDRRDNLKAIEAIVDLSLRQAAGRATEMEKNNAFRQTVQNQQNGGEKMYVNDVFVASQKGFIPMAEYTGTETEWHMPRIEHNIGEVRLLRETIQNVLKSQREGNQQKAAQQLQDPQLDGFFVGVKEKTLANLLSAYKQKLDSLYSLASQDLRYQSIVPGVQRRIMKERFFPEAVSQMIETQGSAVLSHIELDGFNAYNGRFSPDAADSRYHRIFDLLFESAEKYGIPLEVFKKGDEIFISTPKHEQLRNMLEDFNQKLREEFKNERFQETKKIEVVKEGQKVTERHPVWVIQENGKYREVAGQIVDVVNANGVGKSKMIRVYSADGTTSTDYDVKKFNAQPKVITLSATIVMDMRPISATGETSIASQIQSRVKALSELVNNLKTVQKGEAHTYEEAESLIKNPASSVKRRFSIMPQIYGTNVNTLKDIIEKARTRLADCI